MSESSWTSGLSWRREGKYSRSEKTQNAFMDAAESLALQRGFENVSINEIITHSGCSVGSFYHHFNSKNALYYSLYERTSQSYLVIINEGLKSDRWRGASIRDLLYGYMEIALLEEKGRPIFKVAEMLVSGNYLELGDHFTKLVNFGSQRLQTLLMEREAEIKHSNPKAATAFVVDQLSAMLRTRYDPLYRKAMLTQSSDRSFIRSFVDSADAFLRLSMPTEPAPNGNGNGTI